ncbi:hypothetical protein V502_00187 [Neofusicoccum parvum]|uniref:Putative fad binding domain-containing protein n=1 Tax=Botryosphaeria parva (strain UCR-NP2) TaxID=1287680 RepID=R1GB41_BOTPV|nr:putative fad binding domain-containing protein [Neofusicoccum parvum UCRNP2]GME32636.1 hypothetical protein V502_00187 [Neofusicoccum parvum]
MRGGGHMPIDDAANINSTGVLISSTNLNLLKLSDDHQTLSIGAGNRWDDVYEYLDGTVWTVAGARQSTVGVAGYLLGGGMSFYSYEYGFGSTNGNVRAFECVLANGGIVTATATNDYSDLFWALQGGGNSLCIVTRFDMKTIYAPATMLGSPFYGSGEETMEKWIDGVYEYVMEGGSDPKGTMIPVARFNPDLQAPEYSATLFYNGNNTRPALFNDWLGDSLVPADNSSSLMPITLGQYSKLVRPAFEKGGESYGYRQSFHLVPIKANKEALHIVHDTYFDGVRSMLSNVTDVVTGIAWNPVTAEFLAASNKGIGCPQGPEELPVFWAEQTLAWMDAEDDAIIETFIKTVNENITAQLEAIDALSGFYYLNDAGTGQPVFETYPPENLERLKEIRCKYDPDMVFTELMPGGFKIAHA